VLKFEDLLKFVQFDVSEMPKFKVKEDEYDVALDKEIRKIRNKNEESLGGRSSQYIREGSPPLQNLILLTKIDEYLN
jgi:hypothetical protein